MTKKDFIALADSIREHNDRATFGGSCEKFTEDQIATICRFCQKQNSRFSEGIFRGYIAGTCGPNGGRIK